MTWAIVLLALLIINLIRIGACVEYSAEGLLLELKIFCFTLGILPKKTKTEKELEKEARKKEKQAAKKAAQQEKARKKAEAEAAKKTEGEEEKEPSPPPKKGGKLDLVLAGAPAAFDALGTFLRHLRLSELKVYYGVAGGDPYDAVLAYGRVSAAMGVLTPLFDSLRVKDRDLRTALDFNAEASTVYIHLRLDMALWEYVYIVLRLGCKFLVRYLKRKKQRPRASAERA